VVIETLLTVHNAGLLPCVPNQGSVGASGDLAPLAHMTLALMGEGEFVVDGQRQPAAEVLRAKARHAWESVQRPLVVEETGLELAAMNGFPGPLVKWMLEAVGAAGIARTALASGEPRAKAVCLLLWTDGRHTVLARGETSGDLVLPPRGANGFGWDPVFQPAGDTRTYGELPDEEKDRIGHRGRAWRDLLGRLRAAASGTTTG